MKLSLIIPVYNTSKYLKRCLDSVLNQTYKNLEIIIINDGSTDNSLDILREYDDKRIKLIDKKNEGVSIARNMGIDASTGDLIGFVDSDDAIVPDMYEAMIKNMNDYDADISVCDIYRVVNNELVNYGINDEKVFVVEDPIKDFLLGKNLKYAIANKIFKKEVIGDIRFNTELTNSEDRLFIYEIYKNKPKVVKMNKPKYIYYLNSNSASASSFNKKHLSILTSANMIYSDAKNEYKEANNYLFENLIVFMRKLSNNKKEYSSYYKETKNKLIELSKKVTLSKKRKLELFIIKYLGFLYPTFVKKVENPKSNVDLSKVKDDLFLN